MSLLATISRWSCCVSFVSWVRIVNRSEYCGLWASFMVFIFGCLYVLSVINIIWSMSLLYMLLFSAIFSSFSRFLFCGSYVCVISIVLIVVPQMRIELISAL